MHPYKGSMLKKIDDMKHDVSGVIIKEDHVNITYDARYYIVMRGMVFNYPNGTIQGAIYDTQI